MCLKEISEIFSNFGVGFGTLLAGLGGGVVFWNWAKARKDVSDFKKIQDTYHPSKLNVSFKLFRFPNKYGRIYIYDLENKEKHWIKNMGTYAELGYEAEKWLDVSDETLDKEYKNYKEKKDIIAP